MCVEELGWFLKGKSFNKLKYLNIENQKNV